MSLRLLQSWCRQCGNGVLQQRGRRWSGGVQMAACLRVFESNRLEILAECLAEILDEPLPLPLDQEYIVVQSKGMERWLSMELAQRFGIWGNCRYPFPNAMINELIRLIVPDVPEGTAFDPKILAWRIMKRLSPCALQPGYESLRNYLLDDAYGLKQLQLAERLANTFDQYTMFRPEWVLDWEDGKANHWQSRLWRDLTQEAGSSHKAAILKRFLQRVDKVSPGRLPKRLSIFGIPALPPMHLDVFAAMSRHIEVNFFLMNPCPEYWFDLTSEKDTAKLQKRFSPKLLDSGDLHFETGHPLLSSLGKLGAQFLDTLHDRPSLVEEKRFEDPGEDTLLLCLQSDILHLRNRGSTHGGGSGSGESTGGLEDGVEDTGVEENTCSGDEGKKTIAPDDDSIQIHVCHSPMREVEVLYDRLLALFEKKPDLRPRDILVMMPDIESYAPYIGAVFEGCQDPAKKIPYSIADRSARREGRLIEVFLKILGLYGSRFGQTQILDILEALPVQARFGLDGDGLACVRRWVTETRIRWGVDGEDRARQGVPAFDENTWKAGLDRLLLGYALPGRGERMFCGILPYDDIEGSDAAVLGRFLEFIRQLFNQVAELAPSRTLADWAAVLDALLVRFFTNDESDEAQREVIRRLLNDLKDAQRVADFQEKVGIGQIRAWLTERLDHEELGTGFLTGGVTFCTMLPMRSIPHRVVALLGMGDSAFPRTSKPLGFDLMAKAPRKGDPSKRDEDRYLFLEALLCARDYFLISYGGQSIRDNSEIPPSVVVSELTEAIERGFEYPGGKILDHVVIVHRLQAFSHAYFQPACLKPDALLFSYSEENLQALAARQKESGQMDDAERPFIDRPLPEPAGEKRTLSLNQLIQFLANPAQFFLTQRLGVRLEDPSICLDEREPFEIAGLEKYYIEQNLVHKGLRGGGEGVEKSYPLIRAQGLLPPGIVGMMAFKDLCEGVTEFVNEVLEHVQEKELAPLDADLDIDGFRITGRISGIRQKALLRSRYATIKARDCLSIWIEHLVLNCLGKDGYPEASLLIGSDDQWYFPPIPDSRNILKRILQLYWQGLRSPIPFFPRTSLDYAEKIRNGADPLDALKAARLAWEGNNYNQAGEREEPCFSLCFGKGSDPLGEDFKALALDIFSPLLGCRTKKGPEQS
ncbi:MAG: exodeoxyribonuclease V subunit gamma [bacterium]